MGLGGSKNHVRYERLPQQEAPRQQTVEQAPVPVVAPAQIPARGPSPKETKELAERIRLDTPPKGFQMKSIRSPKEIELFYVPYPINNGMGLIWELKPKKIKKNEPCRLYCAMYEGYHIINKQQQLLRSFKKLPDTPDTSENAFVPYNTDHILFQQLEHEKEDGLVRIFGYKIDKERDATNAETIRTTFDGVNWVTISNKNAKSYVLWNRVIDAWRKNTMVNKVVLYNRLMDYTRYIQKYYLKHLTDAMHRMQGKEVHKWTYVGHRPSSEQKVARVDFHFDTFGNRHKPFYMSIEAKMQDGKFDDESKIKYENIRARHTDECMEDLVEYANKLVKQFNDMGGLFFDEIVEETESYDEETESYDELRAGGNYF